MAITSYSDLKTAIVNWLDRDGLDDVVDDFIDMAEAHFARTLRLRTMEEAWSDTISAGGVALPSSYLALKFAYIDGTPIRPLQMTSPEQLLRQYPTRSSEGKPRLIARGEQHVLGHDQFMFGPYPDDSYTIKGVYYASYTPLDDDNPSNWLLTNAPDLYLYRSLIEAEGYIGNDDRISVWAARATAAQMQIDDQDREERWPRGMALAMSPG